jgi:Cathepsin propeptide inhibitor domain (I29)
MHGILPHKHAGSDAAYDAHAHVHGRTHAHRQEYKTRKAQFYASKAVIEEHNAQAGRTYDQGMNQFADWLGHEYHALVKVCASYLNPAPPRKG